MKHWKLAFPSEYFGHQHMPEDGKDMIVTIEKVGLESVKGHGGGMEQKLVAHISADPEKWILNKTNCESIERVLGEGSPDKWAGGKVQLYVDKTSSPKGLVDCVRVRPFPPQG